jgi:hypothetical protein
MSLEKINKRGPRLYGDKKEKGPSTDVSMHAAAIYQFDSVEREEFIYVTNLEQVRLHVAMLATLLSDRQPINYSHSHETSG